MSSTSLSLARVELKPEITWEERHASSIKNMRTCDALTKPMQDLVNEFGLVIVVAMINDGQRDPVALRDELMTWRQRRQTELLATDVITAEVADRMWSNIRLALARPRRRRPRV